MFITDLILRGYRSILLYFHFILTCHVSVLCKILDTQVHIRGNITLTPPDTRKEKHLNYP